MDVTAESRTALFRSRLFLKLAQECDPHHRIEYEAFVEAAIVFARAALHRLQAKHRLHPSWRIWWSSLLQNASVAFFREQRDWLLKEAPPKIGQKAMVGVSGGTRNGITVSRADEFYFFESPAISATSTLARHLNEVERLLREADAVFSE